MRDVFKLTIARAQVEEGYEWRSWVSKIPFIPFKENWEIKIIPPFGGAIVRFLVKIKGDNDDNRLSIYLDCYDELGCFGKPYWEIYPYENDVYRIEMDDIDTLIEIIEKALYKI